MATDFQDYKKRKDTNKSENRLWARMPKFKCKEVKHSLTTEGRCAEPRTFLWSHPHAATEFSTLKFH